VQNTVNRKTGVYLISIDLQITMEFQKKNTGILQPGEK
jgi:hypothetical protein